MDKIDAFKTELRDLLDKYGASIGCDIDGDTHGLITKMVVEIDKKDYVLSNNPFVDKFDLKTKNSN